MCTNYWRAQNPSENPSQLQFYRNSENPAKNPAENPSEIDMLVLIHPCTACRHRMAHMKWKETKLQQACCLAQLCLAAA